MPGSKAADSPRWRLAVPYGAEPMNRSPVSLPPPQQQPLRILIVENDSADAELCLRELEKAGLEVTADRVQCREEFVEQIGLKSFDIVLADYRLPGWTGMDALELLQELGKEIPLILVTGMLGDEAAVECIKQGVSDYVQKDRLARLPAAVRRCLEERELRRERSRADELLQEANETLMARIQELQQLTHETNVLNEMGDLLQTCMTVEEAYAVIGQSAQELFANESGALCVLNASRNLVEAVAVWGERLGGEHVFTPGECWALRRGQVHLVENTSSGPVCEHVGRAGPSSYLCVPMMAQGESLGVLHLQSGAQTRKQPENASEFTKSKKHLVVNLAEHIALALANLRLREALRRESIRDPLTGLFNRRYMEESLERELRRAERKQRQLGMIMLDLDRFKRFNDSFGHEAGDTLLRKLGAFLLTRTRREDIVCRYGGEEFTIILPEASLEVTRQRAEQLREEAKHLTIQYRGQTLGALTLSLGVAGFPEHSATGADLLRIADVALYRAKSEGSDRVVVGQPAEEQTDAPVAADWKKP